MLGDKTNDERSEREKYLSKPEKNCKTEELKNDYIEEIRKIKRRDDQPGRSRDAMITHEESSPPRKTKKTTAEIETTPRLMKRENQPSYFETSTDLKTL